MSNARQVVVEHCCHGVLQDTSVWASASRSQRSAAVRASSNPIAAPCEDVGAHPNFPASARSILAS